MLVLSLFSGIDLLGRGFREVGFCVVSAGDLILGQDIRHFRGLQGRFDGVIGGSPCQDFSLARRCEPSGNGMAMLEQFERVVNECDPSWFLLENVPNVPKIHPDGYEMQCFLLNASECGSRQNRNRLFQFGSKEGLLLNIQRQPKPLKTERCAMASEGSHINRRTWEEFCELQGITEPFDLPDLTKSAAYKVVGNAVNLNVSRTVATAIWNVIQTPIYLKDVRTCACGCGRPITTRQKTATDACRKRVSVNRRIAITES